MKFYFRTGLKISFFGSLAVTILTVFFGRQICILFGTDAATQSYILKVLPQFAAGFVVMAVNVMISAYLYSTERSLQATSISALRSISVDSVVILILPQIFGESVMLDRLIACCVPMENQKLVKGLIGNEMFHYVELRHRTRFLDTMWDIGEAIRDCRYIEIEYGRMKGSKVVTRKVKPVAIMFSEYYFYLTAFIDDEEVRKDFDVLNDSFPTIYRIDRIRKLKVLEERFIIPYRDRFEEGEFRKRIQFMYGGKLQRVKFKFFGENVEAVLDRLPTARILSEEDGVYTVSAEVFGKGIGMWLRSQGERVEVID